MAYLIAVLVLLVAAALFVPLVTDRLLSFEVRDADVALVALRRWVLWRIPLAEITDVQVRSFLQILLLGVRQLHVATRSWGRSVLIVRRRGLPIVITPRRPDAFVAELRSRIAPPA